MIPSKWPDYIPAAVSPGSDSRCNCNFLQEKMEIKMSLLSIVYTVLSEGEREREQGLVSSQPAGTLEA